METDNISLILVVQQIKIREGCQTTALGERKRGSLSSGSPAIGVSLRVPRMQELRRRKISSYGKRSAHTKKRIRRVTLKTILREKVDGKILREKWIKVRRIDILQNFQK